MTRGQLKMYDRKILPTLLHLLYFFLIIIKQLNSIQNAIQQSDCFSALSLSYLGQKKGNKEFDNTQFCQLWGKRVENYGWSVFLISSAPRALERSLLGSCTRRKINNYLKKYLSISDKIFKNEPNKFC